MPQWARELEVSEVHQNRDIRRSVAGTTVYNANEAQHRS